MVNVNEIQETIFEYYLTVIKDKKVRMSFVQFFDILYTKYKITFFDGFLFLYRIEDNSIHVYRNSKYRNKVFSLKTLKQYFNELPKDVLAPILKTANPVAKKTLEKIGFSVVEETDVHYIMQRKAKC